jgi:NADH:ubiquinone oxidoreductase subunit 4 (subunit M)
VILSACYLLWSYQRVFFGEVTREKNRTLPDISPREKWILVSVAVITLWMGIGSVSFTRRFAASCQSVLDQMGPGQAQEAAAPAKSTPPNGSTFVAMPEKISVERTASR